MTPDVVAPAADVVTPAPSSSPQLLRRLQLLAAVGLALVGALAVLLIGELRTDLGFAPALSEQYARLGEVQTRLLNARNAVAEVVLLEQGADSSAAKAADEQLATATEQLVAAAAARPADAATLSSLGAQTIHYGQLLHTAAGAGRAEARRLLSQADQQLDDELLPGIAVVGQQLTDQAAHSSWAATGHLAVWPILVIVGLLAWVSWTVAQLSHRVLNLGLLGAALAALVVLGTLLSAQNVAGDAATGSRTDQFGQVVAATQASVGIAEARRGQLDAVLAQQWNQAREKAFAQALDTAERAAPAGSAQKTVAAFADAHAALVKQLAAADWDGATRSLTSSGQQHLRPLTAAFQEQAAQAAAEAVSAAAEGPQTADNSLLWHLALAVTASIAGAALAVAGLSQRLREYR